MSAVTFQSRSIDRISIRGCSGHVEDAGRGRSPDVHKKSPFPSLWACRPTLDVGSIARNPSQGSIAFGGGTDSKKWSQLRACRVFLGHLTRCTLWHRTVSCNRPSRHRIGRENTGDAHNARWSQPRQASDTTYSPRRASDQKKGHDMGKMSPKVVRFLIKKRSTQRSQLQACHFYVGASARAFLQNLLQSRPAVTRGLL